jgi:hypothetical protein
MKIDLKNYLKVEITVNEKEYLFDAEDIISNSILSIEDADNQRYLAIFLELRRQAISCHLYEEREFKKFELAAITKAQKNKIPMPSNKQIDAAVRASDPTTYDKHQRLIDQAIDRVTFFENQIYRIRELQFLSTANKKEIMFGNGSDK